MDITKSAPFKVLESALITALVLGAAYWAAGVVLENVKAVADGVRDGLREK